MLFKVSKQNNTYKHLFCFLTFAMSNYNVYFFSPTVPENFLSLLGAMKSVNPCHKKQLLYKEICLTPYCAEIKINSFEKV